MNQTYAAHFVALNKNGWLCKSLPIYSGYNGTCFNMPLFTIYKLPDVTNTDDVVSFDDYGHEYEVTHQEAAISGITTNIECIIPE